MGRSGKSEWLDLISDLRYGADNKAYQAVYTWLKERLEPFDSLGLQTGRVIALGLCAGAIGIHLASVNPGLLVTSIEPHSILAQRIKGEIERVHLQQNVECLAALLESIPFGDGSFDAVVGCNVLSLGIKPSGILSEIRRIAKPGSALLLCEPIFGLSRWGRFRQIYNVPAIIRPALKAANESAKPETDLKYLLHRARIYDAKVITSLSNIAILRGYRRRA